MGPTWVMTSQSSPCRTHTTFINFVAGLHMPPLPPLLNSKLKMNSAIFNTVMLTSTLKNTKSETPTVESKEVTHMLMPTVSSKPPTTLLTVWDSVSKPPTCPLPPLPLRSNFPSPPFTNTSSLLHPFSRVKLPFTNTLSPLLPFTMVLHLPLLRILLRLLRPRLHILLFSRLLPLNAEGDPLPLTPKSWRPPSLLNWQLLPLSLPLLP